MNVLESECRNSANKAKMASTLSKADFRSECNDRIFAKWIGAASGRIVLLKGREEHEDWSMCL